MPLSAEFDKLHACHAHSGQEVCLRLCARHNCACRLRESSCSRLLSGDTVVQAAARAVSGPYQLGWVPCGSRLGRTRPAGPALCVLNIHVSPTRTTSHMCETVHKGDSRHDPLCARPGTLARRWRAEELAFDDEEEPDSLEVPVVRGWGTQRSARGPVGGRSTARAGTSGLHAARPHASQRRIHRDRCTATDAARIVDFERNTRSQGARARHRDPKAGRYTSLTSSY